MFVLALRYDLRLPGCRSLKEKRAVLRPLLEGLRTRHHVSVAEAGHQDRWQRATVGVALVSGSSGHAEQWADEVDRFVWSRADVEVAGSGRTWMELDD